MAAGELALLDPNKIQRNQENPRIIFHEDELAGLRESIKVQGILVPLTVYQEGKSHVILDGERRWRCALHLGLSHVPAIVQPKPTRLQNIMMMFAVHNARKDWDPLPTAIKLEELESIFAKQQGRKPKERELAQLASLSVGEVRRLKKLLGLPKVYRKELMAELEKPRAMQEVTVDQVLEVTTAAALLRKQDIVSEGHEDQLRRALIGKFRRKLISSTVAPRKLARLARAVSRGQVPVARAKAVISKLINDADYTIDDAFGNSVEQVDFEHSVAQLVERLQQKLLEFRTREYALSDTLSAALAELQTSIGKVIG